MKTKKWLMMALAVMFALSLVPVAWAQPAPKKTITWRLNTPFSEEHGWSAGLPYFVELVTKHTGGQLDIKLFYKNTLGYKGREIMRVLKEGLVEMSRIGTTVVAKEVAPWWKYQDFGLAYRTGEHQEEVLKQIRPLIEKDVAEYGGVKVASVFELNGGYCHLHGIWSNREVRSLDDVKGLKMRLYFMEAKPYVWDKAGIDAIYMSSSEAFMALKTGVIDAIYRTVSSGYIYHYDEIAKYWCAIQPAAPCPEILGISEKHFNALPEDVQKGLLKAAQEWETWLTEEVRKNYEKYIPGPGGKVTDAMAVKVLKEKGVVINTVPEITDKLTELTIDGLKQWAVKTGPRAQEVVDITLKLREEHPEWKNPVLEELRQQARSK